jgi:hypothetical protein
LLALFDIHTTAAERLAARLRRHFPSLTVGLRDNDPAGYHLVVNALGMSAGDPPPFDPARLDSQAFVGDVVLTAELSPLLKAVARRGCRYQIGTDMLFEQIPAYLEFFGYGSATPDELRAVSKFHTESVKKGELAANCAELLLGSWAPIPAVRGTTMEPPGTTFATVPSPGGSGACRCPLITSSH